MPTPHSLIVLLKAPVEGGVKTRLAATLGATEAVAIYRGLAERQVRAVPEGWPVTVHYDPPGSEATMETWLGALRAGVRFEAQCEGDLGQRLAHAFAGEFAGGAESVIAVGGDCPALDAEILRAAGAALASAEVVIGPARDGGYYLIGLRRGSVHRLFEDIDWSTPRVLEQTRARIREAGMIHAELPVLEDVDDAASWERWRVDGRIKETQ